MIYNELGKNNKKRNFIIFFIVVLIISISFSFVALFNNDNNINNKYKDKNIINIQGIVYNMYSDYENPNAKYVFNVSNSLYVFDFSRFEYDPIPYIIKGLTYRFTVEKDTYMILEVEKI